MKKTWLFILSIFVAFGITFYAKIESSKHLAGNNAPAWKTFVKKTGREIASHRTTSAEFIEAKIPTPKVVSRSPSSISPMKSFMMRDNRVLVGEIDRKYEDPGTSLVMINKVNPNWKDIMGNDLMRFQPEDTKLMVKEELPVIKIEDGQGKFLEQVIITYLFKNGDRNSFKALVDSDTGMVVETWDRTIHEKIGRKKGGITLPAVNDSGIVTK